MEEKKEKEERSSYENEEAFADAVIDKHGNMIISRNVPKRFTKLTKGEYPILLDQDAAESDRLRNLFEEQDRIIDLALEASVPSTDDLVRDIVMLQGGKYGRNAVQVRATHHR